MTNDQWKHFEATLETAPGLVQDMYYANKPEINQDEATKLTIALLCCVEMMDDYAKKPDGISQEEFIGFSASVERLMSAMYGRMLGIARRLDHAVTQQVVLEAELAATGK